MAVGRTAHGLFFWHGFFRIRYGLTQMKKVGANRWITPAERLLTHKRSVRPSGDPYNSFLSAVQQAPDDEVT